MQPSVGHLNLLLVKARWVPQKLGSGALPKPPVMMINIWMGGICMQSKEWCSFASFPGCDVLTRFNHINTSQLSPNIIFLIKEDKT